MRDMSDAALLDRQAAHIDRLAISTRWMAEAHRDLDRVRAFVVARDAERERARAAAELTIGGRVGLALGAAVGQAFKDYAASQPEPPPRFRCPTCDEYGEQLVVDYRYLSDLYRAAGPIACAIDTREALWVSGPATPWHRCDVPSRCYCLGIQWHEEESASAGAIRLVEGALA